MFQMEIFFRRTIGPEEDPVPGGEKNVPGGKN